MKRIVTVVFIVIVLSCLPVFASDDPVLAKIGDEQIKLSDLNRIIGYHDQNQRKAFEQAPQRRETLLRRIVQGRVIGKMAREKGLEKIDEVKEQLEILSNDFLSQEYVKREIIAKIDVTEEDVNLYYKTHPNEFRTAEMVKASHILIKADKNASADDKEKARGEAGDILKRVKAGEDFAKLASEVSDDQGSKAKGGDLGYFARGKMVKQFEDAAFSLKAGEISDVVETHFGFHIIRVDDRKESVVEPYDKVRDRVREKVFNDMKKGRLQDFMDRALKDARVEFNTALLMPEAKP